MAIRIIRPILTSIFSVVVIGLFGSIYNAKDHVILINILFWFGVIAISYFAILSVDSFLYLFFKSKNYPKPLLFDGFSIFAGYLGILIFCLAIIKDPNESLFVNVTTGTITGACGVIQLFIELHKKANKSQK